MLSSSLEEERSEFNAILQFVLECHPCCQCEVHIMRLICDLLQSFSLLSIAFAPVLADPACDVGCLSLGVATAIVNNVLSLLINIDAVTCEGTMAFRWVAYPGTGEMEVKGIAVLYTTNSGDTNKVGPGGWQMSHVFSGFNTAAWIASLGLPCKPPRP